MRSRVSLVRSEDHYDGVKRSVAPFKQSLISALSGIPSLVIKINLVITRTPRYSQGVELATTPVDAVKAFIDFILPFYGGKIIIAEEAAWGDTKDGFEFYGFSKLAEIHPQVKLLDLRDDETLIRKVTHPEGELELPLSKTLVETPFLVSITRPKTHCSVVMTAGIKNVLVGAIRGYANRRKIHRDRSIHYMMASLAEHVFPAFTIIDGTIGMQGGGPVRGTEIEAGWTMASFDALAADSLAVQLMGFDVEDVGDLNLVGKLGLGILYPADEIEILGEMPRDLVTPFKPHRNFKKKRIWKLDG
jgi:uncharacterized protein (DUF362 family)